MKSSALAFWVTVALVGSAAYGSWVAWRSMNASEHHRPHTVDYDAAYPPAPPPGPPIKEFKLIERSGREFDSQEMAGHVWIGSFFFCSCPGPCWQMNQALKGVQDEFKDTDLRLVSITCDPRNDTPDVLSRYADRFQADPQRWLFLTGNLDYLKRIGHDIFLQNVQEGGHRNSALVVDRNGKIRGSYDVADSAKLAEMKGILKELLAEKASPSDANSPAPDEKSNASDPAVSPPSNG